ncbi:hypothetical protein ACIBVL_11220 [Streptomyces sp. NPDC049687]|uniref:hypothetical protein n=1 Tax=Streptomyces sp. NPDC049687 TaxID=3365596 RepID=UPI0037B71C08
MTVKTRFGALMNVALVGAAVSAVLAAVPAHAAGQQYTLQNVESGRCLVGNSDRTVRQGNCDSRAKWEPAEGDGILKNVATGMCLDWNHDMIGSSPYLSPCTTEDYGQNMGFIPVGGNRVKIRPVDGLLNLTGWNTGEVSFNYRADDPEKQLWATI